MDVQWAYHLWGCAYHCRSFVLGGGEFPRLEASCDAQTPMSIAGQESGPYDIGQAMTAAGVDCARYGSRRMLPIICF